VTHIHANHTPTDVLVDAAIAGGSAALGGLTVAYAATDGLPTVELLYGALLAFTVAFVFSLAAARRREGA